jgi:hypothetical protein
MMKPSMEKESLKQIEEQQIYNNNYDNTLNLDYGNIKSEIVTPKITPKNGINKHKVSFTEPLSNFSTINFRDFPVSNSTEQN